MKLNFKFFIVVFSIVFFINFLGQCKPRTIHVFVALCDNENQGIVKVSEVLGDGQNPKTNLYWGAMYGVKTFFQESNDWKIINEGESNNNKVLEKLVFKHNNKDVYLLAEAYDGKFIKDCISNFLKSVNSQNIVVEKFGNEKIYFGGGSDLLIYVGHNGLMEFDVDIKFNKTNKIKDSMMFACMSKDFFEKEIKKANGNPILWTNSLMAPEAYSVYAAINSWINKKSNNDILDSAIKSYSKYQKISLKSAKSVFTSGF